MATSVTINWAARVGNGDVLVDATVAGTHHRAIFDARQLDLLGSKSARQTFIAQQFVGVNSQAAPPTGPTGSILDVTGTVTV